jgi:hypothetical protein
MEMVSPTWNRSGPGDQAKSQTAEGRNRATSEGQDAQHDHWNRSMAGRRRDQGLVPSAYPGGSMPVMQQVSYTG